MESCVKFSLAIVIGLVLAVATTKADVQCYKGVNYENGSIPVDSIEATSCPDGSFCFKLMSFEGNSTSNSVKWFWGCYEPEWPVNNYYKCGQPIEESFGDTTNPPTAFTYTYIVTCCGDLCNNQTLDDQGNNPPVFTGECVGVSGYYRNYTEPVPKAEDVVSVKITANQYCYKRSAIDSKGPLYEWGAISPANGEACGFSLASQPGDAIFARVCTCCDDNCNGELMNKLTVDTDCQGNALETTTMAPETTTMAPETTTMMVPTTAAPPVDGVECYQAFSTEATLPDQPEKVICSKGSFCYKLQRITYEFKGGNPDPTANIGFEWGCIDEAAMAWPQPGFYQCGDPIERSTGTRLEADGTDSVGYFTQYCTCCGSMCNNASYDNSCNTPPAFVQQCNSYFDEEGDSSPYLGASHKNVIVGATADQNCYKRSKKRDDGSVSYEWGALNIVRGKCGDGFAADTNDTINHVCTCCEPNCNDYRMDGITVDSKLCENSFDPTMPPTVVPSTTLEPPSTTEEPMTTTQHEEPAADNTAAIVGGVLGALLAISWIALGYFGYYWYRTRKYNQQGAAIRFVDHE